jgi:hypothetical protein
VQYVHPGFVLAVVAVVSLFNGFTTFGAQVDFSFSLTFRAFLGDFYFSFPTVYTAGDFLFLVQLETFSSSPGKAF